MLNIKDPETERLVRELAAETGETLTAAVREAARERLARKKAVAEPARPPLDWAFIREAQAFFADGDPSVTSATMDDLLYGEDGLPG